MNYRRLVGRKFCFLSWARVEAKYLELLVCGGGVNLDRPRDSIPAGEIMGVCGNVCCVAAVVKGE